MDPALTAVAQLIRDSIASARRRKTHDESVVLESLALTAAGRIDVAVNYTAGNDFLRACGIDPENYNLMETE